MLPQELICARHLEKLVDLLDQSRGFPTETAIKRCKKKVRNDLKTPNREIINICFSLEYLESRIQTLFQDLLVIGDSLNRENSDLWVNPKLKTAPTSAKKYVKKIMAQLKRIRSQKRGERALLRSIHKWFGPLTRMFFLLSFYKGFGPMGYGAQEGMNSFKRILDIS